MPIPHQQNHSEQGFALIGLVVVIFLILLALSVAAPSVARSLRRDREVEAVHRGNQYIRAVQLYYKKTGTYPASLDQLEKTNNIRFLRQRYNDPMTGKPDWRLIKVGEAKTTVKGFFGQPLAGIASAGLGSASGMTSSGGTGTPAGSNSNGGNTSGGLGSASSSPDSSAFGGGSSLGSSPGSTTGIGGGIGNQSATGFSGTGSPFVGVGLPIPGDSVIVLNEQTTYKDWEFLYDPRIEQLKAKVNLFGGGVASTSATGLGSASTLGSGTAPGTTGGSFGGSTSGAGTFGGGSSSTGSSSGSGSSTGP